MIRHTQERRELFFIRRGLQLGGNMDVVESRDLVRMMDRHIRSGQALGNLAFTASSRPASSIETKTVTSL